MRKLLDGIGLNGRRIQMINVSSAMGGQFAWSAAEMTEEIKRIGPNPLRDAIPQERHSHQQERHPYAVPNITDPPSTA